MVPFLGLVYVVLILFRVMMVYNFAPNPSLIFVPFMILFLISAFGVWRGSRIGYALSAVSSGIFLVAEAANAPVGAVTIPEAFISAITAISVLAAVFVYSILGARMTWSKKTVQARPVRMIPASSLVILLVLGFICGALVIGFIAAGTENRLVASSVGGDITIVTGAGNQNNGQFYSPASFTVKAGTTVTWVNKDGIDHTVTSKASSLFDSGNMPTGGTFRYTFSQPGTYTYYCTLHPWMTGIVVVTSG
jgi:plastocyanin